MTLRSFLEQLNSQQRLAVETTEGKVLVLAGAGSGKTSVLTSRIAYLLEHKLIPAENILGLTFTNKAAHEMRQRLSHIVGAKKAKGVFLTTFHSFCMHILRKEIQLLGYTKEFSLYTEKEVKRLIDGLARQMLEHEGEMPSLEKTLDALQRAKTKGFVPEDPKNAWHDGFVKDLFSKVSVCMRAYNAVDFDGLLALVLELFEKFPEAMRKYQEQYRYVLIDEYQDTNPTQYQLAEHLSAVHGNLFVVGDDDQSIYGWRGADVKNILNFPAVSKIKLEQNYRSTPAILHAANAVIANNKERHDKNLWSLKDGSEPLTVFHAPSEEEEAQSVAQRIADIKTRLNLEWKDIAILYRSNALSRPFEIALMNATWRSQDDWVRGIPYEVFGGTELYERSEVKDLYAYLQVILNPLDQESLLRIINLPRRGISAQSLDLLTAFNRSNNLSLWEVLKNLKAAQPTVAALSEQLSAKALQGISSFVELIETFQGKFSGSTLLHQVLKEFLEKIDYQKIIKEDVKSEKMRSFKWENIEMCVNALKTYQEEQGEEANLHEFITSMLLQKNDAAFADSHFRGNKVHLMTFHSAKGLEFPVCFLVGLEDHILPHEKSLKENSLEEERRLFYVALTRSKRYLTLSMATKRKRMGKEANSAPSRFIFEIPENLLKITSWQTI